MHQWKVSGAGACALTIPLPVSVKLDQIVIGGRGAKGAMWINYVDFAGTPHDPMELEEAHLEFGGSAIHIVHRGDALYRSDDECRHLFVVRSGSFKSVIADGRGRSQVVGFRISGEVLGLGGLSNGRYGCDAIALEDSAVCDIPLEVLESACHGTMPLQRHVHRLLSREIAREASLLLLLGRMNTEQRIATFLLDFSVRLHARGYSATEFRLRMTRDEICSFLGIAPITLRLGLGRLQEKAFVIVRGDDVAILNPGGLANI